MDFKFVLVRFLLNNLGNVFLSPGHTVTTLATINHVCNSGEVLVDLEEFWSPRFFSSWAGIFVSLSCKQSWRFVGDLDCLQRRFLTIVPDCSTILLRI